MKISRAAVFGRPISAGVTFLVSPNEGVGC